MLGTLVIFKGEVHGMTFEQIIPLLLGLLIGLLVSVIVLGWWSARAHPYRFMWLTAYDRLVSGLLILAASALGMLIVLILLHE